MKTATKHSTPPGEPRELKFAARSGVAESAGAAGFTPSRQRGPDVWGRLWEHQPSIAKDKAAVVTEAGSPRWHAINERITETFGCVEGLRTIELGCGRGDVSLLLAQRGARVTLLDYTDEALSQARLRFERHGLEARFVRADLLGDLEGLVGKFDVSISYGVVEHFRGEDRTRAIRAHRDVLTKPGLGVISVPNALCPTYRLWKLYLESRRWWPYGMEIPYGRSELTKRAGYAGFSRIRTQAF